MSKKFESISESLASCGWRIPEDTYNCLSPYEKEFLEIEFTGINSRSYYEKRLQQLGLENQSNVLDVGCGMGQWSIALADLNNNVIGTDINPTRLLVAKDIGKLLEISNADFMFSSAEKLALESDFCDAVFCYGVFMFTHMPSALMEFYRVLRPGGKLYVNVNSLGWYLHLLIDRGLRKRNFNMITASFKMLAKTAVGKHSNVIVSPEKLKLLIKHAGFGDIKVAPEGKLIVSGGSPSDCLPTKYPVEFYGHPAITEALAIKP